MKSKSYVTKRVLLGWMPRPSLINFLRTYGIEEEIERLPEILTLWEKAVEKSLSLKQKEANIADTIQLTDLDPKHEEKIQKIKDDPHFKKAFEDLITNFRLVEIDKLIAFQGVVTLDYVNKLSTVLPKNLDDDALIDFCLSPNKSFSPVSELTLNWREYIYSSENTDLRFLGAVSRSINGSESGSFLTGGVPAKGILLLLGFGANSMNALVAWKRVYLNNGLHRLFALRSRGIKQLPMVLQTIKDPPLVFPQQFFGIPRSYALDSPRPPLIGDYFDPDLVVDLKVRPVRRGVKISLSEEVFNIPV